MVFGRFLSGLLFFRLAFDVWRLILLDLGWNGCLVVVIAHAVGLLLVCLDFPTVCFLVLVKFFLQLFSSLVVLSFGSLVHLLLKGSDFVIVLLNEL